MCLVVILSSFVYQFSYSPKKKVTAQLSIAPKTYTVKSNVKIPPSNRPGFLSAPKASFF